MMMTLYLDIDLGFCKKNSFLSYTSLQDSPCDPCMVHCCLHWCALCQEHREMKGHLSDNTTSMAMTVVNPPPVQEMYSSEKKDDAAAASAESSGEENTNKELALQPM